MSEILNELPDYHQNYWLVFDTGTTKDFERLWRTAISPKIKELESELARVRCPHGHGGYCQKDINSLKSDRDTCKTKAEKMVEALKRIANGENLPGYGDDDRSEIQIAKAAGGV